MNIHIYICMNVRTYKHTYHYLLSKVLFKYERKLVGMSICVYVYMYLRMYVHG